MKKNEPPIIVEQLLNHSAEDIWAAITRVDLMRGWFFPDIPDFRAETGFKTRFNVHSGGRDFIHKWQVTEVIPLKMIRYSWSYDGYPGDSYVEFGLRNHKNRVILKLTHFILEDFPQKIPEFNRESCLAGWNYFICQSLKDFLNKRSDKRH